MYYLLYATILSIIFFIITQYIEKNKRENTDEPYDINVHLFTMNNFVVFFMILLINTIIFYYTLDNSNDKDDILKSIFEMIGMDGKDENNKKEIKIKNSSKLDPSMLKRINDPIKHGFEPMSDNEKSDNDIKDDLSDSSSDDSYDSESSDSSKASSIHVKKSKK